MTTLTANQIVPDLTEPHVWPLPLTGHVPRPTAEQWASLVEAAQHRGDDATMSWLSGLGTDMARHRDGGVAWTPVLAGLTGRQTPTSVIRDATDYLAEKPHRIAHELRGRPGMRVPGPMSLGLDGEPEDDTEPHRASPALTWLALMALPLLVTGRTREDRGDSVAVCPLFTRSPTRMTWPVWTPPLTVEDLEVLLTHPAVHRPMGPAANHGGYQEELDGDPGLLGVPGLLDPAELGVSRIYSASRRKGTHTLGALVFDRVVWERRGALPARAVWACPSPG